MWPSDTEQMLEAIQLELLENALILCSNTKMKRQ